MTSLPAHGRVSSARRHSERRRRPALLVLLAALPALCLVFFSSGSASAHGAPMEPGSRTFLCWQHSQTGSGAIEPTNPACQAALDQSGSAGFYNWFSVLRSDGAGRTEGFIPDGQLCSGGNSSSVGSYDFSGFDLPRDDWPVTHLTSGAPMQFTYNSWAAHPGWFYQYVTKDGFDPTQPLGWDDLEAEPFNVADHPPQSGPVGTLEGRYTWTGNLPSGKSGRHIIYTVWERSDSQETFYSCSDVVFDGGNGEVTYPTGSDGGDGGDGGQGGGDGLCTASAAAVNSWNGGYQAEVTVENTGSTALDGWTLNWNLGSGETINSLWNGEYTVNEGAITVTNVPNNGSLAAGESTTVGYVANGTAPPSEVNCSG